MECEYKAVGEFYYQRKTGSTRVQLCLPQIPREVGATLTAFTVGSWKSVQLINAGEICSFGCDEVIVEQYGIRVKSCCCSTVANESPDLGMRSLV